MLRDLAVKHKTREGWLTRAAELIMDFIPALVQDKPYVSIGPCGSTNIGCCYRKDQSSDGIPHIFISPILHPDAIAEPMGVLATLVHEMVHAKLPDGVVHGGKFKKLAATCGLVEPWTATSAGDDLLSTLEKIADQLGPFPHAPLLPKLKARQKGRWLKLECDECGMIIRSTKVWLADVGPPTCACGGAFGQDEE